MLNTANLSKYLTPRKINELDIVLYKDRDYWLEMVPFMQKNIKFLPTEIWEIIMIIVMHLEKRDDINYFNFIYSEYNRTPIFGMTLRNRKIRIPNIYGRLINEGVYVINIAEKLSKEKNQKVKTKNLKQLSKLFLNYIIKWFHWVSESKFYKLKRTLELKCIDLLEQCDRQNITNEKIILNFRMAKYFTQTYYPNVIVNQITHFDYDFETFVFAFLFLKTLRDLFEVPWVIRLI